MTWGEGWLDLWRMDHDQIDTKLNRSWNEIGSVGQNRWKPELCGTNLNWNWSIVEQIGTKGRNQIRAGWNWTKRIRNLKVNRTKSERMGVERLSKTKWKMNWGRHLVVKTKKTNRVWMATNFERQRKLRCSSGGDLQI